MLNKIRQARLEDAPALALLAERTFRDAFTAENTPQDMEAYVRVAFSAEKVREELGDDINTFLLSLGEADGTGEAGLSGYAKLRRSTPDPSISGEAPVELERLYVDSSAIGSGLGATLMRACLDWARSESFRTLWLGVWERNERAIAFYRRWDFEIVGSHPFQLGSDDQTDLVMQRSLVSPL